MELADIKVLMETAQRLGLSGLEARKGGVTLRLERGQLAASGPAPVVMREAAAESQPQTELAAPLSGSLHLSPAPGAPAFVAVGQAVRRGETVCIIEAMKVFNPIQAERDGTVESIALASGVEVEAGQIVMRIV